MKNPKISDYLHKRSTFIVPSPDCPSRESIVSRDVKGNISMVVFDLLKDEELKQGDELTVDVRIIITRKAE